MMTPQRSTEDATATTADYDITTFNRIYNSKRADYDTTTTAEEVTKTNTLQISVPSSTLLTSMSGSTFYGLPAASRTS